MLLLRLRVSQVLYVPSLELLCFYFTLEITGFEKVDQAHQKEKISQKSCIIGIICCQYKICYLGRKQKKIWVVEHRERDRKQT